MPVDVEYARYVKHYPNGDGSRDTVLHLYESGVFEECLPEDPDSILVGEWQMQEVRNGSRLVLQAGRFDRRYDSLLGPEIPPRAAAGTEPDTGEDARLYLVATDEEKAIQM